MTTAKPEGMSFATYHEFQQVNERIQGLEYKAEGFEVSIETSRVARVDIISKLEEVLGVVRLCVRILKVFGVAGGSILLAVATAWILRYLHLTS